MNDGHIKVRARSDAKNIVPKEYLGLFAYNARAKIDPLEQFLATKFPEHPHFREKCTIEVKQTVLRTVLIESRFIKTVMFSNIDERCFYITEFQTIPGLFRVSIAYGSRDRIMNVYPKNIRWKKILVIPNVESPP